MKLESKKLERKNMLKVNRRNNINSVSCNNCCAINISRNNNKFGI